MGYQKQEWIDGETVINKARMEHIENGILDAESAFDPRDARIDDLESDVGTVATAAQENAADVAALTTTTDEHEGRLGALEPRAAALESDIGTLQARTAALEGPLIQAGVVKIPVTADVVSTEDVVFPTPFGAVPAVSVTADTSVPDKVPGLSVSGVTAQGFTAAILRTSGTDTGVHWIAVGTH